MVVLTNFRYANGSFQPAFEQSILHYRYLFSSVASDDKTNEVPLGEEPVCGGESQW
jgi:hypothetical protein